jgi:hypothetical protein
MAAMSPSGLSGAGRDSGVALAEACPRDAPEPPSMANGRHQQQPANLKLARALNPASNARDTLVMRRSSVSDEDLGAEAPTDLRGTLLKSAEAYH